MRALSTFHTQTMLQTFVSIISSHRNVEKEHQLPVKSKDTERDSQLTVQQFEFQAKESEYKIKLKETDIHLVIRIGLSFDKICSYPSYIHLHIYTQQAVKNIAEARLNVTLDMNIENICLKQAA